MDADDAELVASTRAGDVHAFGQLYDRYARLVRAICADATRDLTASQDLAQEVFLRAFQRLNDLREPAHFGAWVVGIARLAGKEWLRRQSRDRHHFEADMEHGPRQPDTETDDRLATVLDLLGDLPEMERLALHTFYLQGRKADEGARTLGLSRSGFYKLLDAARRRLTHRFRQTQEDLR